MDDDELLRVLKAFADEGLEYVLIGATAMGLHGLVRATEDVDLFVRPDVENIERLKRAFRAVYGDDPSLHEISAQDLLGEYPSVRYYPPTGDLYFDVLARLGEAVQYDDIGQESRVLEGITIRVATPRALYNLKKDTVRALDRRDAEALRQRFGLEDT